MSSPINYRGYTIERAGSSRYFFWLNEDTYDGPEGADHGIERGVAACRRAIDEYIGETVEPERCGSCPTMTTKTDEDHNAQCSKHGGR